LSKPLVSLWTKGITDPEKKDKFEATIRASTTLSYRLLEILEEEERELDKLTMASSDFDSPSWAYKQAYRLGEKARLKKLRDLFSFATRD